MSLWVLDVVEITHHKILPKYRPRYPIYSNDCIWSEVECRVTFTISTWNKETNANRIISIAHFNCVIENELHDVFLFLCTTSNINLSHHWMCSWTFIFSCCFRSFPFVNALKAFNLSFQSKFYGREKQRLRILFIESFYNRQKSSKPTFTLVRGKFFVFVEITFCSSIFCFKNSVFLAWFITITRNFEVDSHQSLCSYTW